jgi:hypothetical protein
MKSFIKLILIAALAGLALGVAVACVEVRPWAIVATRAVSKSVEPPTVDDKDGPRAEMTETIFNFGHMERGTTMSHAFTIRNLGNRPLRVGVSGTTCKCTLGGLERNEVPPQEETEVTLEWTATTDSGPFRHGATLTTSDPKNSRIELTIEGEVVESSSIYPPDLNLGSIRVGKTGEAYVYVSSMLQQDVEVLDYKISDEKLADLIDVKITPVDPSKLPQAGGASGVKVTATYLGGTTIGPFGGWLELTTNLKATEKLNVMVSGSVVGDIAIFGPGWIPQLGLLRMGSIQSNQGKRVRLVLAVRGDTAQTTELQVVETDPTELKATLDERIVISDQVVHVPLIVELPQGTPPMVRAGEPASTDAKIVLKSNNPKAPEILLRVQFTVEP